MTTAPDEQIPRLDILVNQPILMHKAQRISCLPHVRYQLLCVSDSSTAIITTEEVIDCLGRVLHHQVGAFILQLAEVIDWQDIWMLQVCNAPCLVKKVSQRLLVELVEAQHFKGHNAAERRRLTYLVDMTIAACANEGEDFVAADMRTLHEKVTARADDGDLHERARRWGNR